MMLPQGVLFCREAASLAGRQSTFHDQWLNAVSFLLYKELIKQRDLNSDLHCILTHCSGRYGNNLTSGLMNIWYFIRLITLYNYTSQLILKGEVTSCRRITTFTFPIILLPRWQFVIVNVQDDPNPKVRALLIILMISGESTLPWRSLIRCSSEDFYLFKG